MQRTAVVCPPFPRYQAAHLMYLFQLLTHVAHHPLCITRGFDCHHVVLGPKSSGGLIFSSWSPRPDLASRSVVWGSAADPSDRHLGMDQRRLEQAWSDTGTTAQLYWEFFVFLFILDWKMRFVLICFVLFCWDSFFYTHVFFLCGLQVSARTDVSSFLGSSS